MAKQTTTQANTSMNILERSDGETLQEWLLRVIGGHERSGLRNALLKTYRPEWPMEEGDFTAEDMQYAQVVRGAYINLLKAELGVDFLTGKPFNQEQPT